MDQYCVSIGLRILFRILFQSFLEANSKCWWNAALVDATRQLRYKGHVSPGVLMVGGPPCALEVLRAAWARNVLRPPADHAITCLGKYSSSPPPHLHHLLSETKFSRETINHDRISHTHIYIFEYMK